MCPLRMSIHVASSGEVGGVARMNSKVSSWQDEPKDAGKFNLTFRSQWVEHEDFQNPSGL